MLADASAANRVPVVTPTQACRYGSTIIDEVNGEIRMQQASPSGTNWVIQ